MTTPYYETSLGRLYNGDCLTMMKELPDNSVDLVLTDPPYSSGTIKEAGKGLRKAMIRSVDDVAWFATDSLSTNGFWWLLHACAVQWKRVLKNGGHILTCIDWRQMPQLVGAIESADLKANNLIVWDKTYFGMGNYFRLQHELIMHFSNGVGVEAKRHDVGNVLHHAPVRNGDHPTEKPCELIEKLLSVLSSPGDLILDPFLGSGTTALACEQLQRRWIGIELSKEYCDLAVKRLGAWKGQSRLSVIEGMEALPAQVVVGAGDANRKSQAVQADPVSVPPRGDRE